VSAARALIAGLAIVAASCGSDAAPAAGGSHTGAPRAVKVMIVNMAFLEGQGFVKELGLDEEIPVTGLGTAAPNVLCNADDVCELTTGMGYANAAASVTALIQRSGLDLSRTYVIIAGIAGVDPEQGTIGTAAWARYVVDFGFANEIDAREMPAAWPYGYFGIGAAAPSDPPANDYDAAVFQIDEALLQAAYALSKDVALGDSAAAAKFRANYASAPANEPPRVTQCDVVSSDTWFAGNALTVRAREWTKLLTNGKGVACMSAQEDNATLEVLKRGAAAGKVDLTRVLVLRTASDFAAPYGGQTDADGLVSSLAQGGIGPSTENLFAAASPVIRAIVTDWSAWRMGTVKP
jgi:purine nucleoside permease